MKHIETNFLIYDLAKKGNTKKGLSLFKFLFSVISICSLFIIFYLLNVELRPNLAAVESQSGISLFNLQFYIFSINLFLGSYLSYKLTVPGQDDKKSYKILNFIFYGLWLALISTLTIFAYNEYMQGQPLVLHFDCIDKALLALILPIIVIFYYVKKGYILNKNKTMVTACLTAFSFSSFINLFVCPANDAIHILFSHNLVVLPVILLFAMLLKFIKTK